MNPEQAFLNRFGFNNTQPTDRTTTDISVVDAKSAAEQFLRNHSLADRIDPRYSLMINQLDRNDNPARLISVARRYSVQIRMTNEMSMLDVNEQLIARLRENIREISNEITSYWDRIHTIQSMEGLSMQQEFWADVNETPEFCICDSFTSCSMDDFFDVLSTAKLQLQATLAFIEDGDKKSTMFLGMISFFEDTAELQLIDSAKGQTKKDDDESEGYSEKKHFSTFLND